MRARPYLLESLSRSPLHCHQTPWHHVVKSSTRTTFSLRETNLIEADVLRSPHLTGALRCSGVICGDDVAAASTVVAREVSLLSFAVQLFLPSSYTNAGHPKGCMISSLRLGFPPWNTSYVRSRVVGRVETPVLGVEPFLHSEVENSHYALVACRQTLQHRGSSH